MLRINICQGLGLCNGSIWQLVGVHSKDCSLPSHESTDSAASRPANGSSQTAFFPSLLVNIPLCYKGLIGALSTSHVDDHSKCYANRTVRIDPYPFSDRRGLPVSVAQSVTIQKSQSLTMQYCIIDSRDAFHKGLFTVFSRSPSLERLALISRVSKAQLNKFRKQAGQVQQTLSQIQANCCSLLPFVKFTSEQEASFADYHHLGVI